MFSLSLSKDQLRVEPGSAATLAVTVHNKGESADRYEVNASGLDSDWVAIPVPSFILAPGEERTEKILIKPPRASESKAGAYPFAVKVRSLESGEGVEAPAVLEVDPFNLLSLEVEPKRASAGYFKKQAPFAVTAINLGNTEQNLQMFADDPEDGCTYQFAQERVQLSPGQQKDVWVAVQPKHFPVVGSTRLYGFTVSARSTDNPLVVANAQGQVERRALLTPAFLMIVLLAIALGSAWFAMRPRPAAVDSFDIDPPDVQLGQQVKLRWRTTNAKSVDIKADGEPYLQGLPPSGEKTVIPSKSTTFQIYAVNELGRVAGSESTVTVRFPVEAPAAKIDSFSLSPKEVNLGDTVTISYKVRDAAKVELLPFGVDLPVNLNTYDLRADQAGSLEVTLVAYNSANKAVSETRKLTVKEKSEAKILVFRALLNGEPLKDQEIEPNTPLTIEWQVTNAARIEIEPRIPGFTGEARGTIDIVTDKSTQYTLTAVDSSNRPAIAKLSIKVKAPEPAPSEGPPPR